VTLTDVVSSLATTPGHTYTFEESYMSTKATAARIYEYGEPDVFRFETMEVPDPVRREVLVRNTVTGLNFVDIYYRRGTLPVPEFPAIIGDEASGVVEAVGPNVTLVKVGDRVAYADAFGAYTTVRLYAPELKTLPAASQTDERELSDRRDLYKVKGEDKYLYRALDSTGQTIDFLLTAKRDTAAAKRFLRRAIDASGNPMPRVMNVDKNPAYPAAMEALKAGGTIPRRVALRQCKYLHRTVKKRVWLAKGYGSFQSAWRTLQGIEAVNMIRKGRVRWLAKGDGVGQAHFIGELFGLST
jgi:IS6 family transposase